MAKKSHFERLLESLERWELWFDRNAGTIFYGVLAGFGGDFTVAGSMKV